MKSANKKKLIVKRDPSDQTEAPEVVVMEQTPLSTTDGDELKKQVKISYQKKGKKGLAVDDLSKSVELPEKISAHTTISQDELPQHVSSSSSSSNKSKTIFSDLSFSDLPISDT
jgi:hypothetical protein